ncbi:MAG: hypothetical protein ACRC0L_12685, partial [Angustibacter sp.]
MSASVGFVGAPVAAKPQVDGPAQAEPPPELWRVNTIDRESLWRSWGAGRLRWPSWLAEPAEPMSAHRHPADPPTRGPGVELPRNIARHTQRAEFPHGRVPDLPRPELHAVTAAFGVQFI